MRSTKVLMYSFKGGAGRTVTTANVAYLLASEFNRRTLCIDLDLESAGASVLFEAKEAVDNEELWTVQDILRGYFESRDGRSHQLSMAIDPVDFEKAVWPRLHKPILSLPKRYLSFCPARTIPTGRQEVGARFDDAQERFEKFLQKVERLEEPPQIILMDSASGLQDAAHLGLMVADILVLFVRWSRQFVFGSMDFLREYVSRADMVRRLGQVLVVPTAVPRTMPSGELGVQVRARQEFLQDTVTQLNKKAMREYGKPKDWILVRPEVPECDGLKWDDRIFLAEADDLEPDVDLAPVLASYRELASLLSDRC